MCLFIYHEEYNKYDLGLDHPLIGDKPRKVVEFFEEKHLDQYYTIVQAPLALREDLLRVHSQSYLDQINQLSKTGGMLAADTPAPPHIYQYASRATGGTVLAGEQLFEDHHLTMNPLGGFHHASREVSSGFCFFNDIAVVIERLRAEKKIKKVAIVDIDVHHCNGTQEIYFTDPDVLCISLHQDGRTLYPGTGSLRKIGRGEGEGFIVNIPLPPGTSDEGFSHAFNEIVPFVVQEFSPDLIVFQSGVDMHHADPLGDLNLTFQQYYSLGNQMRVLSKKTCDKIVVLFGGGYNSDACIQSYYNLVSGLFNLSEFIEEEQRLERNLPAVKVVVDQVKHTIVPYWKSLDTC